MQLTQPDISFLQLINDYGVKSIEYTGIKRKNP